MRQSTESYSETAAKLSLKSTSPKFSIHSASSIQSKDRFVGKHKPSWIENAQKQYGYFIRILIGREKKEEMFYNTESRYSAICRILSFHLFLKFEISVQTSRKIKIKPKYWLLQNTGVYHNTSFFYLYFLQLSPKLLLLHISTRRK